MKQGWEYKKLGDICTIERGGSPRPISEYITEDPNGINWIKIGDAVEGSKYINSTKERIRVEGMKKSRFVHKGDFILSNSMSFGKPYILGVDGCIHDGWLVIHDDNNTFIKDYLYYYLSSPTMYRKFESLAVGGVVNNLNSQLVRNVYVSIPSIEEQKAICSLLDKMNRVIEAKKEQLKELDNLAQAIFYDMFGDPTINDKGWQMKKLCEVGEIVAGSTPSTNDSENWDGDVNWVTPAELGKQLFYGSTQRKLTQKGSRGLTLMPVGTVLLSSRAPIGKLSITTEPMCCNQGFKNVICNDCINNIFLYHYLLYTMEKVQALGVGATFKEVSKKAISGYMTILPPLSLQQAFAEKVEAIERQKDLINQSIREVQALFDSRMDYYFGD